MGVRSENMIFMVCLVGSESRGCFMFCIDVHLGFCFFVDARIGLAGEQRHHKRFAARSSLSHT